MKSLIPVLAFSSLLLAAAPAFAQGSAAAQAWKQLEQDLGLQTVYSVDMVTQVNQTNLHSRMVRNGDKCRTETEMPLFNIKIVTLEIPEGGKTVSYALFPDKKKYAVDEGATEALAAAAPPQIEELGTETHEGVVCIKRRVTDVRKDFRNEMTILFSPDQKNMPVKMTMNATMPYGSDAAGHAVQNVIVFKNYDFSTPDDSLFAIPADYVKASSMTAVMRECMPDLGAMPPPPQPPPPKE